MSDIRQFSQIHLIPPQSIADEPLILIDFWKVHNQVFVCQSLM